MRVGCLERFDPLIGIPESIIASTIAGIVRMHPHPTVCEIVADLCVSCLSTKYAVFTMVCPYTRPVRASLNNSQRVRFTCHSNVLDSKLPSGPELQRPQRPPDSSCFRSTRQTHLPVAIFCQMRRVR